MVRKHGGKPLFERGIYVLWSSYPLFPHFLSFGATSFEIFWGQAAIQYIRACYYGGCFLSDRGGKKYFLLYLVPHNSSKWKHLLKEILVNYVQMGMIAWINQGQVWLLSFPVVVSNRNLFYLSPHLIWWEKLLSFGGMVVVVVVVSGGKKNLWWNCGWGTDLVHLTVWYLMKRTTTRVIW